MSAQSLIESMEKLLALHNQLHETAVEKTKAIHNNDVQELNRIFREEQKYVAAIQVADKKRQQAVALLSNGNVEVTISDIIDMLEGSDREQLTELQVKLLGVLTELKEVNALNQQLLTYSLQFVNMNLDLLAPEPELPNYSKTQSENNDHPNTGRSIFDSKA
ncbi:flagellar protein FlgN [Lederbergia citrea]|uniref:flagellar protein FlgN n=1 Tax=Lederbergia citrea TaxID=2833581 RepID=UPI001BC95343|nr:flagellar protein FlgN [Lederbergia citrea]MBS4178276.1 flagellar protein FlgN [Lederbergia citrea]MBS4204953.1 flagellar protein FlgN [Lederbergia citrea]